MKKILNWDVLKASSFPYISSCLIGQNLNMGLVETLKFRLFLMGPRQETINLKLNKYKFSMEFHSSNSWIFMENQRCESDHLKLLLQERKYTGRNLLHINDLYIQNHQGRNLASKHLHIQMEFRGIITSNIYQWLLLFLQSCWNIIKVCSAAVNSLFLTGLGGSLSKLAWQILQVKWYMNISSNVFPTILGYPRN